MLWSSKAMLCHSVIRLKKQMDREVAKTELWVSYVEFVTSLCDTISVALRHKGKSKMGNLVWLTCLWTQCYVETRRPELISIMDSSKDGSVVIFSSNFVGYDYREPGPVDCYWLTFLWAIWEHTKTLGGFCVCAFSSLYSVCKHDCDGACHKLTRPKRGKNANVEVRH